MVETGDAREVHRSFGLTGADEDSAIARAERVNVAGAREIFGACVGIGGGQDSGGAIGRAGAGGGAAARVDWFAEGRAEQGSISRRDGGEIQGVATLLGEREANQAAAEFSHEVDGFGRDFFGGHGQVAFVFAVFVVHQDDHAAGADFLQRFFHGCERQFAFGHWIRLIWAINFELICALILAQMRVCNRAILEPVRNCAVVCFL